MIRLNVPEWASEVHFKEVAKGLGHKAERELRGLCEEVRHDRAGDVEFKRAFVMDLNHDGQE